jgi:mannose-6-phosphate isomerase-like protein (cupin superfamily)
MMVSAMDIEVVNFKDKFKKVDELHSYKIIAQMNNYYFKIVKAQREFIWHSHPETDESFIVLEGNLQIHLKTKTLNLDKGDMVVIPRGVEHKPSCKNVCHLLLIEPVETLNTGDKVTDVTDTDLEWI